MLQKCLRRWPWTTLQKQGNKFTSYFRYLSDFIIKYDDSLSNVFIYLLLIFVVERRLKVKKFISDYPQTIQIDFMAIDFIIDHLGAQVLNGTTYSFPLSDTMHTTSKV